MALILEVTSYEQRDKLGDTFTCQFGREGGTIGRSIDNDWLLPDSKRYISSHHATIDFQAGSYYLIDTSTNGVYVNGSDVPVGAGRPQRLFDGDRLRMGEYEISVSIDEGFELLAEDEDHRSSIARKDLVLPDDDDSSDDLLDAEEITGSQSMKTRLSEPTGDTSVVRQLNEAPPAAAAAKVTPMRAETTGQGAVPSDAATAAPASRALPADPVDAFLQGLGIKPSELGKANKLRLMHNAGLALREYVLGSMELLQNRAAVKNTFRLEQTTIHPRYNNPIKFAASTEDAIRNLLKGNRAEYADADDSVHEVCQDLKQHEIALVCAIREAFKEFADRFDPDELEQKFDKTLKRSSLFGAHSKAKYWELYRELYQVMTDRPEGQYPQLYGDEFARAYGEHLDRLRRDASLRRKSSAKPADPVRHKKSASTPAQGAKVPSPSKENAPEKAANAAREAQG